MTAPRALRLTYLCLALALALALASCEVITGAPGDRCRVVRADTLWELDPAGDSVRVILRTEECR